MIEPSLKPFFITKNIIRVGAITGFTTAALFISFAAILLQKIPGALHMGIGMITCTICSILNVKIHEKGSHDNDAGAPRNLSGLWSSAIGGVLLGIFFAIEKYGSIQNTASITKLIVDVFISSISLSCLTAFTCIALMCVMAFLLLIPLLVIEGIIKIFHIKKNPFIDENLPLLFTTIYCSIAIMYQFYKL